MAGTSQVPQTAAVQHSGMQSPSGMAGELAPGDGRASERGLGYFQVDCYCEALDPKYVFVEPWAQGPCPCLCWLWRWVLLKLWGQLFGCSQKLPCNDSACKESNSMTMSIECRCEKLQGDGKITMYPLSAVVRNCKVKWRV